MQKYIQNYLKQTNKTTSDFTYCEVCGNVAIDIHHIVYRSQGGSDEASNLVALCRVCHKNAHDLGREERIILQKIANKRCGIE